MELFHAIGLNGKLVWRCVSLFVSVFALSWGCTSLYVQSPSRRGLTYEVWIDRQDVEDPYEAAVFDVHVADAVEDWNRAVPGLTLKWKVRRCDAEPVPPHVICVFDLEGEYLTNMGCPAGSVGCTTRLDSIDSAVSAIDAKQVNAEVLGLVARHEIGHALGLKHETPDWNGLSVMVPVCNLESERVTCRDVEQFWRARGIERACITRTKKQP